MSLSSEYEDSPEKKVSRMVWSIPYFDLPKELNLGMMPNLNGLADDTKVYATLLWKFLRETHKTDTTPIEDFMFWWAKFRTLKTCREFDIHP